MVSAGHHGWLDKSMLMGRIEQQLEDIQLVKALLRQGLLDRQQVKAALSLRRQIGVSLATSLLLSGGLSLDTLATTLQQTEPSKG